MRRFPLLLAFFVPYLFLVGKFFFVVDDAFISFRYARNFALGHGLRYNLGDPAPVEGYSNFLWVLVCALFESLRVDLTVWPPLLSAACGLVLLTLVHDRLRRVLGASSLAAAIATLSLACFPPFALWSTGGLATMPFALLVFVTFDRLVLRSSGPAAVGGGIAALLLALIRIEGIAWAAVIYLLAAVSHHRRSPGPTRALLRSAAIPAAGFAIYFGLRFSYYGTPLPNTASAKMTDGVALLARGWAYVFSHALTFVSPFLIVPGTVFALRRTRIAVGLPVAVMAWAFPAYAVAVTGDWMPMSRLLVPGFAFHAILLGWMIDDSTRRGGPARWMVGVAAGLFIFVAVLPGFDRHLVPDTVRARWAFRPQTLGFRSEHTVWSRGIRRVDRATIKGTALRAYAAARLPETPRPSYVASLVGAIGYYSDLYIFDRYGLVTPEVVHRERDPRGVPTLPGHDNWVPSAYFARHRPTILYASVVPGDDPSFVSERIAFAKARLRKAAGREAELAPYVVDFAPLPVREGSPTSTIITWTLVPEERSLDEAWADFEDRWRAFRTALDAG